MLARCPTAYTCTCVAVRLHEAQRSRLRVGIVNVSGYAGSELAGLLWRHPDAEIVSVTGRSAAGKRLPEVLPHLWQIDLPVTKSIDVSVDVAFSALPSGASAAVLAPIVQWRRQGYRHRGRLPAALAGRLRGGVRRRASRPRAAPGRRVRPAGAAPRGDQERRLSSPIRGATRRPRCWRSRPRCAKDS